MLPVKLKQKKTSFTRASVNILRSSLICKRPEVALMSIKPEFADKIVDGSKRYEFRIGPIGRDITHIIIYVTSPIQQIVGVGIVNKIMKESPSKIWERTKGSAGISRLRFRTYFMGKRVAYAIELKNIISLKRKVSLSELGPNINVPQSFYYVASTLVKKLIQLGLEEV